MDQLPAEIAAAADLLHTAEANLTMAEDAYAAARAESLAANEKASAAGLERDNADQAEADARRDYLAALRAHGYVRTADGPKPAAEAPAVAR